MTTPPSLKHEAVKKVLAASINSLSDAVPKVNHIRGLLEIVTAFRTLPWGVHFENLQMGSTSGVLVGPELVHPKHIVLYLHGGGYSIGSSHTHRALVGSLAKSAQMKVLLIDYHKAPEFPFPAALNDAVAAYRALIELKGYQAKYITIAGDSAGGGLALAVQHACKERKLPMPGASICLSPWVDLVEMGGSIETNADKDPLIDIRKMRFWASSYAGEYDITHSLISPLYGKFNDFGPILIQTSRDEMLYDNARKLARKAETAGVDITLQTWDGLIHWWHLFTGIVPEADEAVEKAAQFLLNTYELPTLK